MQGAKGIRAACAALVLIYAPVVATDYYVALTGGHVPPFTTWESAATNIQDAIDVAAEGDTVWVTNGVYATGGKAMTGGLTNRVVLDKALTLASVNGPFVTTIQGRWDSATTNGPGAIRCVWMTNGATLNGFSLIGGATLRTAPNELMQGGAVFATSTNATVLNSIIQSNSAYLQGGGCFSATVANTYINQNVALNGGGSSVSKLINCTVTGNRAQNGGGTYQGWAYNTLVFGNLSTLGNNYFNYISTIFQYSCSLPKPSGIGNVGVDPQLLPDGYHLSVASPCRGAGTNSFVLTTDIEGDAWSDPPSIGCDEWAPEPFAMIYLYRLTGVPRQVKITSAVTGQPAFSYHWLKDGQVLTNNDQFGEVNSDALLLKELNESFTGSYQLVVSNAWGVATSAVKQLSIHFADARGKAPIPPYTNWSSAALTIQDAVDAAAPSQGIVLVNDGIYSKGGRIVHGDLSNRVAITAPIALISMNGPNSTKILGKWDAATTNGTEAIRGVYLGSGAVMQGFTVQDGATRFTGANELISGGGIMGAGRNESFATTCVLIGNSSMKGGGAAAVTLVNSVLKFNLACEGGGAYQSTLLNCVVTKNQMVPLWGQNPNGSGVHTCSMRNSIVYYNSELSSFGGNPFSNEFASGYTNCCIFRPTSQMVGTITNAPMLLSDGIHIAMNSPCRVAGTNAFFAVDIDGQPWSSPTSIGCDEWSPAPLIAHPKTVASVKSGSLILRTTVLGEPPYTVTWFSNDVAISNSAKHGGTTTAELSIHSLSASDNGRYHVVVSNSFGSAASGKLGLIVHHVKADGTNSMAPYLSWDVAATNIQDAIDSASDDGAIVLVGKGVYAAGGRSIEELTNRVVVNKPIVVMSMNGPDETVIEGAWNPISTNGPAAVRCVWLGKGASLGGLTLRNGATWTNGGIDLLRGGGLWSDASLAPETIESANCVITNCSGYYAGGAYGARLIGSKLRGNFALSEGGGAYSCELASCFIQGNSAKLGGGTYIGTLVNCTVRGNRAVGQGGGVLGGNITNSVVYGNKASDDVWNNYWKPIGVTSLSMINCCTTPQVASWLGPSSGTITLNPEFVGDYQLAVTSPCRQAGTNVSTGVDLDGEPWMNPPSMGCDEIYEAGLTGALAVAVSAPWPAVAERGSMPLFGGVAGRVARLAWDFGDGSNLTNASLLTTSHVWTNAGNYSVIFTAYNSDFPGGVSTNLQVQVLPLLAPAITNAGFIGTNFALSFPGQPGITYTVQQTTNLDPPVNWLTLGTISSTGQLMQVIDTKATNDMQFYRVNVP